MWELIKAGGWLMLPLVICSIITVTIIIERGIRLQRRKIAPYGLVQSLAPKFQHGTLPAAELTALHQSTPLGDLLATGIEYSSGGFEYMTLQMQNRASVLIHRLEKNLNLLGTIGTVAPLLGLLGTVIGIIESFLAVNIGGNTDPAQLASGISQALMCTAAGMIVAIPALISCRYYQRKVADFAVEMEEQSGILLHMLQLSQQDLLSVVKNPASTHPQSSPVIANSVFAQKLAQTSPGKAVDPAATAHTSPTSQS